MNPARWHRIQGLFHEVADLPEPDRRAFLKTACSDDEALLADLLAMLEEDARGASLLDRGVGDLAHGMIGKAAGTSLPLNDFGPYRITSVLGEGGMGVVYRAERTDLGSVAAIKILRDAWLSPARRDRFAREQRTLAQLNHPSIARLLDADTLPDGTPWFVMEYVEGVPLTEYCRTHGTSIVERLRLFRTVCEAVQHAHQCLVIHRDLKPSNILVKEEGGVKLLDFGISKQLDSLDAPIDQTRTGLRLMTPAYAAPEQIRGGRAGIETDVYSLGVVLYELLAGQLPFDLSNRTPTEAEAIIVEQEPEKPSAAAKHMAALAGEHGPVLSARKASWADLDVLCLTAMHKDPARRYRTVEALIRDIDHYLKGQPLDARPDTVRYRAGTFARRRWRLLSASAVVLAAIVGLVVFYTVRLATARNEALAEAARTQRIQRFMLNLFEGGDKQAGPAESLRVLTLIDRGVQEARTLSGEPAVQAELYATLGSIYQKLGNFAQAESLLRAALDQRRTLFGPDHADVAENTVALGLLRTDQAQFDEAERLIRQGLEQIKRRLPPNHPVVANATAALGKVLEDRGTYDKAIPVLEEAVRLHTEAAAGATTPDLAAAVSELANTHFYAGHLEQSDSLNRRALAMHQQLYGDRHPLVSDDLINLGAVQFEQGRYVEAERFYRQGLEITQAWYGKDHFKTAANLTMLARALNHQKRYVEAVELLQQSLAIRERVYGNEHPLVASSINELGTIALGQGKFDDAERHYRRMVQIYRAVYGPNKHYLIGIALSNFASVYLARGEWARAESLFREAIALYVETLSANHLNTGIARIKLGRSLVRQHRYAEAEIESRAGYEILHKQMNPTVGWLQNARKDLIEAYDALNQPDKAQRFRADLAHTK
jgi:serine/threonine protein kinase/tetratricopeptide (TPR) repeat protein